MQYFILTAVVFGIFFVFMAIGVILSNKKIEGSCGGIANLMGEDARACDCGRTIGSCQTQES